MHEALWDRISTYPRKRVPLTDLADAAYAARPDLLTAPERRATIAKAITILEESGLVRVPTARHWDRTTLPLLPQWIERIDPRTPRETRPPTHPWTTALAFLDGRRLTQRDHQLFSTINHFLLTGGTDSPQIPLRDRASQLFGDEKRLDALPDSPWVRRGLLSITQHLRAYLTPEPLNIIEMGPAPWLLVVENTATFDNLRRIMRSWPRPGEVGWIAFGDGDRITSSITTVPDRLAETGKHLHHVLYYGDLDDDGLHCISLTSQRAVTAGLPPLQPASALYKALLQRPSRQIDRHRTAPSADLSWLPPPLARDTAKLLAAGSVIRQEALALTELRELLTSADTPLVQQLTRHAD
ncbi:hypothetical protein V1460_29970 [Streptomyces sp. SCSIO 30461]|uniref:hypothetical protein n=1 Tax=Streptomyces sp. SCSIO 30461 TaxID=3118085 RepID=UPI0030D5D8B9